VQLCEELFNAFMTVAVYPQHPFGFTVRLVEGCRASCRFGGLCSARLIVFDRWLRRYASGNQMVELRLSL
jgi:hypothetical protein